MSDDVKIVRPKSPQESTAAMRTEFEFVKLAETPDALRAANVKIASLESQLSALKEERDRVVADASALLEVGRQQREQLATLKAKYETLRAAVNESTDECLPGCSSYGHEEKCPSGDPARWLEDQQKALSALKEERDNAVTSKRAFVRVASGLAEEKKAVQEALAASSLRERTLAEELKIASAIIERVHAPLPDGASETPAGQHNQLTTYALQCECVFCKRARTAASPSETKESNPPSSREPTS